MRLLVGSLWLAWLSLLPVASPAQLDVPPLERRVTDLTGTLAAADRERLERKLADFEGRVGSQIAVLMLRTTAPEAISSRQASRTSFQPNGRDASIAMSAPSA